VFIISLNTSNPRGLLIKSFKGKIRLITKDILLLKYKELCKSLSINIKRDYKLYIISFGRAAIIISFKGIIIKVLRE
jgi:hypothetical protein